MVPVFSTSFMSSFVTIIDDYTTPGGYYPVHISESYIFLLGYTMATDTVNRPMYSPLLVWAGIKTLFLSDPLHVIETINLA